MKFLIDNALSPLVAVELRNAGHEAVHVRDIAMAAAEDEEIFAHAAREEYVLVSADTDFGTLHTLARETKPSVIILKRISQRRPHAQAAVLLANLPNIHDQLEKGGIAVFEDNRIRVRSLPLTE